MNNTKSKHPDTKLQLKGWLTTGNSYVITTKYDVYEGVFIGWADRFTTWKSHPFVYVGNCPCNMEASDIVWACHIDIGESCTEAEYITKKQLALND